MSIIDRQDRLWLARTGRGFSQARLGEALRCEIDGGVSAAFISQLEMGKKNGRVAMWEALARALRVRPAWLLYGEGRWPAGVPTERACPGVLAIAAAPPTTTGSAAAAGG
jgi:transcriptional regulator with XRE-family HTH domain